MHATENGVRVNNLSPSPGVSFAVTTYTTLLGFVNQADFALTAVTEVTVLNCFPTGPTVTDGVADHQAPSQTEE